MDIPQRRRYALLAFALLLISGVIALVEQPWQPNESTIPDAPSDIPAEYADLQGAPDFAGATNWLTPDGEAVDLLDLRGEVVLVDFWTYSCVNCIRTLPHLTAWHDAYKDHGLTIVGVHSPEFRFEKKADNVLRSMDEHGIEYPVAQDNDFDVWDAYHNRFWPAKYLVGPWGKIHYTHFGEGAYQETEAEIRSLLQEAGITDLPAPVESGEGAGQRASDVTPELYAGYWRQSDTIGNHDGYARDEVQTYTVPDSLVRDKVYLAGDWYNGREAMRAQGDGKVALAFRAGAMNFVSEGGGDQCIPVFLDGEPVSPEDAGPSVVQRDDGSTCVQLSGPDAYHLYAGPVEEHVLELHVPDGFELYTFAFSRYAEGASA